MSDPSVPRPRRWGSSADSKPLVRRRIVEPSFLNHADHTRAERLAGCSEQRIDRRPERVFARAVHDREPFVLDDQVPVRWRHVDAVRGEPVARRRKRGRKRRRPAEHGGQ
jgi:hypothetical protein